MSFRKKINFKEIQNCPVCLKKVSEGITMKGYEKYLPFVCNECFRDFFSDTKKLEERNISVDFRPADIKPDEYRLPYIVTSQVKREMFIWFCINIASY
ncbi:MAG: hypothetical protein K2G36_07830, partial [Ruminococcus sp.]|nr:hypothetical protein [Ruminococcus sp.]